MSKKLFDGENTTNIKMKYNKPYAEKLKKKKEREMIDKAKAKYGDDYQEKMEEELHESSSSISEDENGELINENFTSKFIETLAKIRYKHPDIYKVNEDIFEEEEEGCCLFD